LEFLPFGEDDAFDDAFEFFILIPQFEIIPGFQFEQAVIFIEPLTFDFLLELQNPPPSLSSPIGVGKDPRGLIGVITRLHLPGDGWS